KTPSTPVKEPETKNAYTIADHVIIDNDVCKVTVVSATTPKSGGVTFKILLENKTADKKLMFGIDDVSVNGWMIDPFFARSVQAGKQANDNISFSKNDFEECGITTADKITMNLRVYDDDDWTADEFVDDVFTFYPTGLTDAEIKSPERTHVKDEVVVVDDENCTFVILGTHVDSIWGYTISVYLENKTADKNLLFSWDDVSVNGFMIDPFWGTSVPAGCKKFSEIDFSKSDFEDNDIKEVETIEYNFSVSDNDDWMADDLIDDIFTYEPAK
ncbi:MAG: hypothetical protein II185_03540, partial [Firmicutes bacterium]|nr:hypothetical protein [Bacillota bacterium]